MTMLIKYENPTLVNPMPRVYDLDNERDLEQIDKIADMLYHYLIHLHTGEALVFECLDRDDDEPESD